MNIPVVLEIQKYSLPVTQIVESRIQTRLVQNQQVPIAIEVQTTEIEVQPTEIIHSVDGVPVKKLCISCKHVPVPIMMICLIFIGFFCFTLMNTFKFNLK